MKHNNTQNILATLLHSVSNDYYLDYHLENYKQSLWANTSQSDKLIFNTIKKYKKHHEDFKIKRLKPICEYFKKIVKNDTLILFENTYIYKELYKVLHLIDATFQAQELLNDSKAYPAGFAQIQTDLREVKRFKHNLFKLRSIVGKKESRFKYWFATIYIRNKTLAKFFTHLFLRADIVKIKEFQEDKETAKKILEELEFILMQHTTISKLVKSFGILLYWEMIKYLNINKKSAEEYTSHIIYELFRENFNSDELHKVIEMKSSLLGLPIFGASKKATLKDDEKQFIHNKLLKEVKELSAISNEDFKPHFTSYINNPHIQFLEKYPVEFFRVNPKYSSSE